jgi:DNA invertase Pin-like site-specific DNA recombinase
MEVSALTTGAQVHQRDGARSARRDRRFESRSKLVFTILSAVAEAERDRTWERIRDVKRDKRYLGGAVPFGWPVGPTKEPIEDQNNSALSHGWSK